MSKTSRSATSGSPRDLASHVVHGREDLVPDLRPRAVARIVEKAWFHPIRLGEPPLPVTEQRMGQEPLIQPDPFPLLQPPAGGDRHPGRADAATLEHAHRDVRREDVRIPVGHVRAQVQDILYLAGDGLPCGPDRLVKLLAQPVLPGVLQPPRQRRELRRTRGETSHALSPCLPGALLSLGLLLGLRPPEPPPLTHLPPPHPPHNPFPPLA